MHPTTTVRWAVTALVAAAAATGPTATATAAAHPVAPASAAARATPTAPPALGRPTTSGHRVPPPLTWTGCGDGLDCAPLTVPVDWREPDGPTTTLELARLPALDPQRSQGALVVNVGGPSTTIGVIRAVPVLVDDLRRSHDVVLMDPRGLGDRTHVVCPTRPAVPREELTRESWERFRTDNAAWDATCRAAGGPVADHLNSWQVAHDLDAVRAALGEPQLDYVGNSYGTAYGAAYAEQFPDRVGRMYLDSVVDHTGPGIFDVVVDEARAIERNFDRFGQWCAAAAECAGRGTDLLASWTGLLADAERAPLPAPSRGTVVTAHGLRNQTREMLESPPFASGAWPQLAAAIVDAVGGDAAGFLPRERDPAAPPPETSVYSQSFCADIPFDTGFDNVAEVEERLRAEAPRIGWTRFRRDYGECAGLALTDTYPLHPIAPAGLSPVLVAGGELDTATPVEGAAGLVRQLPGSRLITADDGHALYLHGNPCVRDHVHRYLADGTLPPVGASCPFGAVPWPGPS